MTETTSAAPRGRATRKRRANRDLRVDVRFSADELTQADRVADELGWTRSALVRLSATRVDRALRSLLRNIATRRVVGVEYTDKVLATLGEFTAADNDLARQIRVAGVQAHALLVASRDGAQIPEAAVLALVARLDDALGEYRRVSYAATRQTDALQWVF